MVFRGPVQVSVGLLEAWMAQGPYSSEVRTLKAKPTVAKFLNRWVACVCAGGGWGGVGGDCSGCQVGAGAGRSPFLVVVSGWAQEPISAAVSALAVSIPCASARTVIASYSRTHFHLKPNPLHTRTHITHTDTHTHSSNPQAAGVRHRQPGPPVRLLHRHPGRHRHAAQVGGAV